MSDRSGLSLRWLFGIVAMAGVGVRLLMFDAGAYLGLLVLVAACAATIARIEGKPYRWAFRVAYAGLLIAVVVASLLKVSAIRD